MSVVSVLHKIADELNRPQWHEEIDSADVEETSDSDKEKA